jgi:hypothetical protein
MTPATLRNPATQADTQAGEASPLLGEHEDAASSKTMLVSRNLFGGARALFTQVRRDPQACLIAFTESFADSWDVFYC